MNACPGVLCLEHLLSVRKGPEGAAQATPESGRPGAKACGQGCWLVPGAVKGDMVRLQILFGSGVPKPRSTLPTPWGTGGMRIVSQRLQWDGDS